MYLIKKILNPEIFQGKFKNNNYFEGWYFKLVDKAQSQVYSIIPGVSKSSIDNHAFIQIINGITGQTHYIKYDIKDFIYSQDSFKIIIASNLFSNNKMLLDIDDTELKIKGTLNFINIIPYPKRKLSPGIMGYYSFIPFMECYHGIVNIHHEIKGILNINSHQIDFTGGYGYIEKDWGSSFPESWIWMQSNHFNYEQVSFMFSIAKIPWFSTSFIGFISFVKINNNFYIFGTYTKATITSLKYDQEHLYISITDNKYNLSIKAELSQLGGNLAAPVLGNMNRTIKESINSNLTLELNDNNGELIYKGTGKHTGLELSGNITEFLI